MRPSAASACRDFTRRLGWRGGDDGALPRARVVRGTRRSGLVGRLPFARRFHAELRGEAGLLAADEGEQLAAAADAEALVQGLDVVVDGVAAQLQLVGDLLLAAAG